MFSASALIGARKSATCTFPTPASRRPTRASTPSSSASASAGSGTSDAANLQLRFPRRGRGNLRSCYRAERSCLLQVVVRLFLRDFRFGLGVGIRIEELDSLAQAHPAASGSPARRNVRLRLHAGHIPLQASEIDLRIVTGVNCREAIAHTLEARASVRQIRIGGNQPPRLQPGRQLFVSITVGIHCFLRILLHPFDGVQRMPGVRCLWIFWRVGPSCPCAPGPLRSDLDRSKRKTNCRNCKNHPLLSHVYPLKFENDDRESRSALSTPRLSRGVEDWRNCRFLSVS